jgi:hypothetical protein
MFLRWLPTDDRMSEMRKLFLLLCQLFVLGILVIWSSMLGIQLGFYERVWWWDIVSHILGGLWVGLFAAWFAAHWSRRVTVFQCVVSAIMVGVGWEVYEYLIDLQHSPYWPVWVEILKDLFDDALGGSIAGYFVTRFRR